MDLGFVLVATPKYPDAKQLVEEARKLDLELTRTDAAEMLTFDIGGGGTAIFALMPVPHPDAPHMPTGPTAISEQDVAAAKAHFIVSGLELPGDVEARDFKL